MKTTLALLVIMSIVCSESAIAGVASKAAREAAEDLLKRFGREVAGESVETLSVKVARYGAKYGDESIDAIRSVGPRGFKLLDDAGENAGAVVKLLNTRGNDAVWVASNPNRLAIFVRYGDDAADAMIKHRDIVPSVIEQFGHPAARALSATSSQSARRVTMMSKDGSLSSAGKAEELLDVVGKYGDRAADFIWNHKGALAVSAVAIAFIADPVPFIDGTRDLAEVAIRPVDTAAKEVGRGIAAGTNWTPVVILALLLAFLGVLLFALKPWKWYVQKSVGKNGVRPNARP